MNKKILLVVMSAFLMSASAMASAKYLYFVIGDGKTQKVFNLNMDPLYSAILSKSKTLVCEYKDAQGEIQGLDFHNSICGGGPIFTLDLGTKLPDGQEIGSSASALYVDHRSVMVSASILAGSEQGIDFSVMSATQYAMLLKAGSGMGMLPRIEQVPSVSRQESLDREDLTKGAMNCRTVSRQDFCESHR